MKDELFNAVYELLSVAQVSGTTPDRAVMAVARVVASRTSCMDTSESASFFTVWRSTQLCADDDRRGG